MRVDHLRTTVDDVLELIGAYAAHHEVTDVVNGKMITCFDKDGRGRKVILAVWVREQ